MTVLNLQVAASGDDGHALDVNTTWIGNGAVIIAGAAGGNAIGVACRFLGSSALAGATINAAIYSVYGHTAQGGTTPLTKLRAEAATEPAAIADYTDYHARTLTAAGVDWDDVLDNAAWNESPDITPVIEEVLLLSPTDIQIFEQNDGATDTHYHAYRTWDHDTSLAPKLTIDYTAAAASEPYGGLWSALAVLIGRRRRRG